MTEIIIITISQVIFSFSRTLNVRYTANEKILMSIVTSAVIKLAWLISSTIGIKSVMDGNWILCGAYITSGAIGDFISFKVKI